MEASERRVDRQTHELLRQVTGAAGISPAQPSPAAHVGARAQRSEGTLEVATDVGMSESRGKAVDAIVPGV